MLGFISIHETFASLGLKIVAPGIPNDHLVRFWFIAKDGVDMTTGWETPSGYPASFTQKILASDIDETNKRGSRTRLLKLEPGRILHGAVRA